MITSKHAGAAHFLRIGFAFRRPELVFLLKSIVGFLLFVSWCGISECSVARAVIVGINQYETANQKVPPDAARHSWTDLDGAVSDAEEMKQVLVSRFGFQSRNIFLLTDRNATREKILSEIRTHLLQEARPDDLSVFFYAGHGSQRFNSASLEPDKMDETIVPADSNRGVDDIRDKELSRLFDEIVEKKVLLTVILDSCHSGSAARGPGKARKLEPDMRDVHDSETPALPEQKGALVLSAAQDYESAWEAVDDNGDPHGAFTYALIKTLRSANPKESAEQIFRRATALMQSDGAQQGPVLAALPFRRTMPLFGGAADAPSEMTIAVEKVEEDTVVLQAGKALNLDVDCELHRIPASNEAPVRLRVVSLKGITESKARVTSGKLEDVHPGDLFVVDHWVTAPQFSLKVWMPPPVTQTGLQAAKREMESIFINEGIHRVEDPTVETPDALLTYEKEGWMLFTPDGKKQSIGDPLDAEKVLQALKPLPGIKLFVALPPIDEITNSLQPAQDSAIQIAAQPGEAHYTLAGRAAGDGEQYSWILAGALQRKVDESGLPVRTQWVDAGIAAKQLEQYALRLAKIRAWLTMESPPDEGAFPYRLALKNASTGALLSDGTAEEGQRFGLTLQLQGEPPKDLEKRWVYIFAIDNNGNSSLLFPRGGGVENRVPYGKDEDAPAEIPLGPANLLEITPPFGVDHYFLLSTSDPISDPGLLEFEGVRKEQARGVRPNTLEFLLMQNGTGQRGVAVATPANWALQRFSIHSMKKNR